MRTVCLAASLTHKSCFDTYVYTQSLIKFLTPVTVKLKHPKALFLKVMNRTATLWPDKIYLKIAYYLRTGKIPHLSKPKTFSEKLNWLKINYQKSEYTKLVDKIAVKDFVTEKLGSTDNIIKTLGVWDSVDEINFSQLPNKFVLKTNNGGGNTSVYICKDKSTIDIEEIHKKIKLISSDKLYRWSREYPYYSIAPRIIAEEYIEAESSTSELKDYKFFCFNGKVRFLKVDTERNTNHHATYLFTNWTKAPFKESNFPSCETIPEKPKNYEQMVMIAENLAEGIPFVRVDLYNINGRILFGEMTFFPVAGFDIFQPEEWDEYIGNYLTLPTK